jgi:thiamine biosynthesis lipoprotein
MGCEVVVVGASPEEQEAVERLFAERDRTFSRFRDDSELNAVNAAAGTPVRVSAAFADMLRVALDAARETAGSVTPTLGAELELAGYDADFSQLRRACTAAAPASRRGKQPVRLYGRTVVIPDGIRLDLNGVVKGKTVDDALALLGDDGFVSAGGDLAVKGSLVASLPRGGAVRLLRGALATSGSDRRRWIRDGELRHHLIDPSTGSPANSPWEQVTVCARTCVGADVAAKAAFLLGNEGPSWLDQRGLPGRFVAHDGTISLNESWLQSLGRAMPCM